MQEISAALFGKPEGIIVWQLIAATRFTIYLSLIAFFGGGVVAAFICFARISPSGLAKRVAASYIWIFQSIPLLMILFLAGLGVPRFLGINVDPWTAAALSLTIFTSAYLAEVWRGAFHAVPSGQWEGGAALGLSFIKIFFIIILPQAYRYALGPTVGFLVQIIKGTSLAYIIGFQDLMLLGKRWANSPIPGSEPYLIFPLMALIYFALCFPLSKIATVLEKKHSL
jgi:polar amino acid transport system permease protein|tara:strand:+ start:833 stop:1510 length:678 start_codon:yes stop_codon:yes gene_type:complete